MISESLSQALRELWNPEYQHVVLLPFLVHGLILCGLMALGATVLKQNRAGALALLLLAACALAVIPYLQARDAALAAIQGAHTKYEATAIAGVGDQLRSRIWVYYVLAGVALLALIAGLAKAGLGMVFGILAAILGMACGIWGLDLHYRESRVYHPNLLPAATTRPSPPASTPAQPPRVQPARPVPQPAQR